MRTSVGIRFLSLLLVLALCLRAAAAEATTTAEQPTGPPPGALEAATARAAEAEGFETHVRQKVIAAMAKGRGEWLPVTIDDKTAQAQVVAADEKILSLHVSQGSDMALSWSAWRKMDPRCIYRLACAYGPNPDAAALVTRGRYCLTRDFLAEADADLHRALDLDQALLNDVNFKASWDEVASRRAARSAPATIATKAPDAKRPSQRVDDSTARILARLGKRSFMLGISCGPRDASFADFLKQGIAWDVRYQYLSGSVNGGNWSTWDQPAGSFVSGYCGESAQLGVATVFSLYTMRQSSPGGGLGEAPGDRANCANVETMKAYWSNVALFFDKAAAAKGPVILHIEPDLWGYMQIAPEFKPNSPEGVQVMVKSTGIAEFAKLGDDACSFGKAFSILRDKHAPNVLLAFHASAWGNPPPAKTAEWAMKTGPWDLIFADMADRDAGWRMFHKQGGHYTSEAEFDTFRGWAESVHKLTGLPFMLWQMPYGNNIMAACNNTPGHFMDTFAPYFLEGYPANTHLAEYAAAGVIGIMFGGTMGDSTYPVDATKDGITNPAPIDGNKGEKSQLADDDGGYMRLRGAAFYKKPLQLAVSRKVESSVKADAASPPAPAERPATPEAK